VHASTVSLAALGVAALISDMKAFQALTLTTVIVYLNPGLREPDEWLLIARWIPLVAASTGSLIRRYKNPSPWPTPLPSLVAFVVVAGLLSLLFGVDSRISLLKLGTFVAGSVGALLCSNGITVDPDRVFGWLRAVFAVVVGFSLPLLVSAVGYRINGSGFQGIWDHPNGFAVYLVPMTAFLAARLIVDAQDSKRDIILVASGTVAIVAAASRTAVLAAMLGIAVSLLCVAGRKHDSISTHFTLKRVMRLVPLVAAGLLVAFMAKDPIWRATSEFAQKRGTETGTLTELLNASFTLSRGGQVETTLENIRTRPFAGVGFGLESSEGAIHAELSQALNLPLTSPTEAGFLPLAVLGQVGIVGTIVFVILLWTLASPIVKYGSVPLLILFWTTIFVNFGEMAFFATGGLGLHIWILVGFVHALASRQRESLRLRPKDVSESNKAVTVIGRPRATGAACANV
jgi:hypothetical protein